MIKNDQTEMSIFSKEVKSEKSHDALPTDSPLAYKLRPTDFKHFIGQKKALTALQRYENSRSNKHIIFWGPPGCGKTTLALMLAKKWEMELYPFNAVMGGVTELRKIIQSIQELYKFQKQRSIIFIDEIHRFNKAQQDALLPHLERGDFILLGATTENPRTSLNKAILSRVQTIQLLELEQSELLQILKQVNQQLVRPLEEHYLEQLAHYAHGDARFALNKLELLSEVPKSELNEQVVVEMLKQDSRQYDKAGDRHYDVISAFIKSIRGSDPDAAIFWLAVMLEGGEDPLFIARRLVIAASEEVGNADPMALQVATASLQAIHHVGMPEARIPLAQAASYLASAPKSNAAYLAINKALAFIDENKTMDVPTHLRNHHPDKKNYKYPHSYPNHYIEQQYLADEAKNETFYRPTNMGHEKYISKHLQDLRNNGKREPGL